MPPVFGPASASLQALVILRGRHGQDVLAVGHDDEARFLARQEFLDDHQVAGRAELAVEHRLGGGDRLVGRVDDDHALAGGQAAGLDDDRRALRGAPSPASKVSRVNVA